MDPLSLRKIAEFAQGSLAAGDAGADGFEGQHRLENAATGRSFCPFARRKLRRAQVRRASQPSAAPWARWSRKVGKARRRKTFALIRVPDTLVGYQTLAANYRKSLPLKVIVITGSNGKTSTKDFVAATLVARVPSDKDRRQFQQSRRSSADHAGGVFERRNRRLGNRNESSGRNRRALEARRAGRRDHHERRPRAHRIHGQPRSDRRGKRRAGGSGRRRWNGDSECGRSL